MRNLLICIYGGKIRVESIIVLALSACLFGFLLVLLLSLSDKKRRKRATDTPEKKLSFEQFGKACLNIIEGMKLEIESVNESEDSSLDIVAQNPTPITGGRYLVHCLSIDPKEVVASAEILELSNMVVQERYSKGIFMTTGRFTQDIPGIGELAPIEFIDGDAFGELLEKYAPDYLVILS